MKEFYEIQMVNGEVDSDEVVKFLADTGAPIASSLLAKLESLIQETEGTYSAEEAIPRLFGCVHSAFREVAFAVAQLEVSGNGDAQSRGVTVQLVEKPQ